MKWVLTFGALALLAGGSWLIIDGSAARVALGVLFWVLTGLFTVRLLSLLMNGR